MTHSHTSKRAKVLLLEQGLTISDIARQIHLSRPYTSKVIHGQIYSKPIRESIARVLGKDVGEIWPEAHAAGSTKSATKTRKRKPWIYRKL